MGASALHNEFGFFGNGDLRNGLEGFSFASEYVSSGGPLPNRDLGYLKINGGGGGTGSGSHKFYPDVTDGRILNKDYQQITYMKTLTLDSNGNKSGGHIGMIPYDKNNNTIDQRSLGGRGDTTLSRNLNAGDSYIYITSNSGWSYSTTYHQRMPILYPSTHPDYNHAHEYTRIGFGSYNLYYSTAGPELTDQGDYKLTLTNGNAGNAATFPNIGYSTPSGTPISNGRAGSSYMYGNYLGVYPMDWTRRSATYSSMGNFGMGNYLPWGVKYLRFLILKNYTYRTGPNDGSFAIANMFVGPRMGGKDYSQILI
jgi:hypothetical protein